MEKTMTTTSSNHFEAKMTTFAMIFII